MIGLLHIALRFKAFRYERNLFGSTVEEMNYRCLALTISDLSYDRSHGSNADWQKIAIQKMIQKAALAGLETTDQRDAEFVTL
jgi:hypothetical protein